MKRVLILGKDSYIGESIKRWLDRFPTQYQTAIVSTKDHEWLQADFTDADAVVNVAGIAHINKLTEDLKPLFYSVNRDLAIEMGTHAKARGVKHFIQFSSMNVYGDYGDCVTDLTLEAPGSFYGDSKLQGDMGLRALEDETFAVAYLRPPFVYGKGCKGNYNVISGIARKTPAFPTFRNRKSMIYIDNLCEFVRLVIEHRAAGVLAPQNRFLASTCDMVRAIAAAHGKKVWFTGLFNWCIPLGIKLSRTVQRAFADDCYEMELSDVFDFSYCVVDFEESIRRTEQ